MKLHQLKHKAVSAALAVAIAFSVVTTGLSALAANAAFSDVPDTHWAASYINMAAENDWVSGVGDGKYNPEGTVTNAEFITMLTRAFYQDFVNTIPEQREWWGVYVVTARMNGITYNTAFHADYEANDYQWGNEMANTAISRYDMAMMMYNLLTNKKITISDAERQSAQSKIGDWSAIPATYQDCVATVYALGVISGTDKGAFEGGTSMTRAQAATVLCKLSSVINNTPLPPASNTAPSAPPATPEVPTLEPTTPTNTEGRYDMNVYTVPADANQDGVLTVEEVSAKLEELREEYPAGTAWGPDEYYYSPTLGASYGCAAYAFMISDRIFGNLPQRHVHYFDELRPGDAIIGETHSFVVYDKNSEKSTTTEGNVGNDIVWGTNKIVSSNARSDIAWTRYPA